MCPQPPERSERRLGCLWARVSRSREPGVLSLAPADRPPPYSLVSQRLSDFSDSLKLSLCHLWAWSWGRQGPEKR